ncbi:hypothetical protein H0I39_20665 [Ottowia beijingensis]|uniref:Uncharacterized protein n=1 Tax=Ottowia beijingensis TaxID=1207057 RepID=A0A853IZT8_9BURK|nr:hypothetical protein [Ottowia beijingensis]NZA03477.1 hypothetical protein [Ottowia beijingensis]
MLYPHFQQAVVPSWLGESSSGATAPHHPERVQAWSSAVQAARQLADEFEAWPARPDPAQVQPL